MLTGVLGALRAKRESTGDPNAFLTAEELRRANTIARAEWLRMVERDLESRRRRGRTWREDELAEEWRFAHGDGRHAA